MSKDSDEWGTPQWLFDKLNEIYGPFTLDPCAANEKMAKCENFFTEEDDGLSQDWGDHIVFCNPPYSEAGKWVEGVAKRTNATLMLLNAKTGPNWFHEYVIREASEVGLFHGRIKFWKHGDPDYVDPDTGKKPNGGRTDNMIVYFPHSVLRAPGVNPRFFTLSSRLEDWK